jgi:hypothetical protein
MRVTMELDDDHELEAHAPGRRYRPGGADVFYGLSRDVGGPRNLLHAQLDHIEVHKLLVRLAWSAALSLNPDGHVDPCAPPDPEAAKIAEQIEALADYLLALAEPKHAALEAYLAERDAKRAAQGPGPLPGTSPTPDF